MRQATPANMLLLGLIASAGLLQAQQQPAPQPRHVSEHDVELAQRAFEQGGKAIVSHRLPAAVAAFRKAATLDPSNKDYDAALAIARDNLATQLMQQALKARLQGDTATFRERMEEAAEQDSHNPLVLEHENELAAEVDAGEDATLAQFHDNAGPPVTLAPQKGVHSFHLDLPEGEILRQVLGAYGITPMLDSSVASDRIHFDADSVDFAKAEQLLNLATDTFFVPLDPRRALVALDTRTNRDTFERLPLETVYVPGADANALNDVSNVARNVFQIQHITVDEAKDTLTLRGPQPSLRAFNIELNEMLEGRSETMLDIGIYEVQRERMVNEGAQLPQSTTIFNVDSEVNSLVAANPSLVQQIISSGLASPGNLAEIAAALVLSGQAGSTLLSQPFAVFGGGITTSGLTLGQSTANAVLTASDTRMLDHVQLYLLDQEEGNVKIGESYPIVTSSYSNLATGSTSIPGITSAGLSNTLQNLGVNLSALSSAASATVPQVQYQDIGLLLDATPRVQAGRTVSLKLHFQLSSLSGQTLNGNPILNNRQAVSIVDVKPGQKTVLMSLLSNQESNTLIGLPFLSEIPGFTYGTDREVDKTQDTLVIILTPHILHLSHVHDRGEMVMLPPHS